MKKARGAKEPKPSSMDVDPPTQTDRPQVTQVYSVTPQVNTSTEVPKIGVVLEKTVAWKPPNPLPTMVDQICQVHRRLENLLTSFTIRAPPRLLKKMNEEFFRIQREADMDQHIGKPTNDTTEALLKSQELQLQQLARQLANSESLNDINIETIFLLEEESSTIQTTLEQAQNEVFSLKSQKGEALEHLKRLQEKFDTQQQLIDTRQQEMDRLNNRLTDVHNVVTRQDELINIQREEKLRMESKIAHQQQEITGLGTENQELSTKLTTGAVNAATSRRRETSTTSQDLTSPIVSKEKHTLTAGVANKLLNELRRDLNIAQQENQQLKLQLTERGASKEEVALSQSTIHPKTEVYHQIISHTTAPESVMQCHRAYGGLNLLLGGVSLLQTGCSLEPIQAKQIWDKADATAKDTIAFKWCLGDIKLPHGTMEVISGCPPFYIKRYVLRCIKLLGQHPHQPQILKEPLPTLRSYTHGQYHLVKNLQRSKPEWFQQALKTLAAEDVTVCYEAVRLYQDIATKHPYRELVPTANQLKQFATKTFEEQQTTLSTNRFGTINSGTLLMIPRTHQKPPTAQFESIGTCFL